MGTRSSAAPPPTGSVEQIVPTSAVDQRSDSARLLSCPACATCPLVGPRMIRLDPAVLIQCAACRSWVYLPRPTAAEQATRHDLPAYFDHPYFSNRRGANVVAQRRCQKAFASIGSVISLDNLAGERLLDVGCDTGAFLSAAVEQVGVVPLGVDVSSRAVREAQQNGIEAYHADLQTAPATVRDLAVITAIDLIEHVVDPGAFLAEARSRLRPGGVLYLETPNISSVVYQTGRIVSRLTGTRPRSVLDRLFPAEHIVYFNRDSLVRLAQKCGLEVVRCETRVLPANEIAVSPGLQIGLRGLQIVDWIQRKGILLCLVLRRFPS